MIETKRNCRNRTTVDDTCDLLNHLIHINKKPMKKKRLVCQVVSFACVYAFFGLLYYTIAARWFVLCVRLLCIHTGLNLMFTCVLTYTQAVRLCTRLCIQERMTFRLVCCRREQVHNEEKRKNNNTTHRENKKKHEKRITLQMLSLVCR